MTKREKIIEKFKKNPESLSWKEIETLLEGLGFTKRLAKGSHIRFIHQGIHLGFAIHNGECKNVYKKATLKTLQFHKIIE